MSVKVGLFIMGVSCLVSTAAFFLAGWFVDPPAEIRRDVILGVSCALCGVGVAGAIVLVVGGLIADWKDGL